MPARRQTLRAIDAEEHDRDARDVEEQVHAPLPGAFPRMIGASRSSINDALAIAMGRSTLTAGEDTMDVVFIERRFELVDNASVVLRFLRPEPDGDDYRCAYEIIWPDRVRNSYAMGIDAVQALLLAMQTAHVELQVSPEYKSG